MPATIGAQRPLPYGAQCPLPYGAQCPLPYGAQSYVFQFAIQKYKDQDKHNYNFACCFLWCKAWFLALTEEHGLRVFREKGAAEEIWA
jgi:hypothetical protein